MGGAETFLTGFLRGQTRQKGIFRQERLKPGGLFLRWGGVTPAAYGSSWARDGACATAVTMLNPEPLGHQGTPKLEVFFFFRVAPEACGGSQARGELEL